MLALDARIPMLLIGIGLAGLALVFLFWVMTSGRLQSDTDDTVATDAPPEAGARDISHESDSDPGGTSTSGSADPAPAGDPPISAADEPHDTPGRR